MARAGKNASVGASQTGVATHGNFNILLHNLRPYGSETQGQVDITLTEHDLTPYGPCQGQVDSKS